MKLEINKETKSLENHYQVCLVTLSDGQVVQFTGQAFATEGDTRTIRGIEFTVPRPLPDGSTFGRIGGEG